MSQSRRQIKWTPVFKSKYQVIFGVMFLLNLGSHVHKYDAFMKQQSCDTKLAWGHLGRRRSLSGFLSPWKTSKEKAMLSIRNGKAGWNPCVRQQHSNAPWCQWAWCSAHCQVLAPMPALCMLWNANRLLFSQVLRGLGTWQSWHPLINFHSIPISSQAVMRSSWSVDYFTFFFFFGLSGTRSFSYLPLLRCKKVALNINKTAALSRVHSSNRLHHNDLDL